MHTTIYDVVNELYKAFLSDFINEESEQKADKIRKQLDRLKKEEGSLAKELREFTSMLEKYLTKEFTNREITDTVLEFIKQVTSSYIDSVWNDFNYEYSVEENRAYFWKLVTERYYIERKSDTGEILKANDNSFFALTYNLNLKKFGISSPERIEDLFKNTTPRNLDRKSTRLNSSH